MTKISPKIIFFGTEDYSLITLKSLVENSFNVVAVVTKPDSKRGRGHKLSEPPVKIYALQHQIPVWQPSKLSEITDRIIDLQPVAGILVAYGKIIPQSTIDLFKPGIINVHPSLLPRWRGPSPIEATISNLDSETGVTIMQLEAGMDSGPVYAQTTIPLKGTETKPELYDKLFGLGNNLLIKHLPGILSEKLLPTPQDHNLSSYCSLLSKEDSFIRPSEISAINAEAAVRAHLGFPRTRMLFHEHTIIITKAHVSNKKESSLSFKCSDDKFFVIDELVAPSGKTMLSTDFLRGYAAKV